MLYYKIYQRSSITKRIQDIIREEKNIHKLSVSVQKDYFSGKISSRQYNNIMNQHRAKLAKMQQESLKLRSKRIKLMKPEQVLQELEMRKLLKS